LEKSYRLVVELYKELQNCKDYGLKDQMTRAAVSIPSNIAEDAERKTKKEFINFFSISKGSEPDSGRKSITRQKSTYCHQPSANISQTN
jgi:S23 ribosomal protein